MLSATVMSRNGLTIWCGRTSPRATTWSLRSPLSSSPRKRTLPDVGGYVPTRQEKRVVFPAPLGPITEKISPRCTSKDTESSARSPPKRLLTEDTARIFPSSAGTAHLPDRWRRLPPRPKGDQPLPEPHDPLRLEEHHHDEQPSVDEEVRVEERRAGQQLDLQVAEEQRAQHRASDRRHPAHDRHEHDGERQPEVEHAPGADVLEVGRKQAPPCLLYTSPSPRD